MHMANTADMYGEHIHVRYCHTEYDIIKKKVFPTEYITIQPCQAGQVLCRMHVCIYVQLRGTRGHRKPLWF